MVANEQKCALREVIDIEEPFTDFYVRQKISCSTSPGDIVRVTKRVAEDPSVLIVSISIVSDTLRILAGDLAGSSVEMSLPMEATVDMLEADVRKILKPEWIDIRVLSDDGSGVNKSDPVKNYGSLNMYQDVGGDYAVKIVRRDESEEQELVNEIQIMKSLDHPNVVKLVRTFADSRSVYLVMELYIGGELFDRIVDLGSFSECQARTVMRQLLRAVEYCHSIGVCHRDVKPEKILLKTKGPLETSETKLCGFGASCVFTPGADHTFTKRVGTAYYIAPEVIGGSYDEACDLWSCGVILYIMLCGQPPFDGETDAAILSSVSSGNFRFNAADWGNRSEDVKNVIRRLLDMNPRDRCTASEALNVRWFEQSAPPLKP